MKKVNVIIAKLMSKITKKKKYIIINRKEEIDEDFSLIYDNTNSIKPLSNISTNNKQPNFHNMFNNCKFIKELEIDDKNGIVGAKIE